MRNQPKYNFLKNTSYALSGLEDLVNSETSFKIELILTILLLPAIFILEVTIVEKSLLFISLMGILISEATNSAIERVVDLVTLEYHDMAKRAKDVGSCIVFLSIIVFIVTWMLILYNNYYIKMHIN